MKKGLMSLALLSMFSFQTWAQVEPFAIGVFSEVNKSIPEPWQEVRFDEKIPATQYQIKSWGERMAVYAEAQGSMALMARSVSVDLDKTPVLCWAWRIESVLEQADMTKKSGDDYAARMYVAFKLPDSEKSFGLKVKLALARKIFGEHVPDLALNYVWDNKQPVGTQMPNAYTERAHMIVLQQGNDKAQQWVVERRNVLLDAHEAFGELSFNPSLIGLAADTDNTGEKAQSGFADIYFVAEDSPCPGPVWAEGLQEEV